MSEPDEVHYSRDHEWISLNRVPATVGITDYAQRQLGEVVYVDLPTVGDHVKAADVIAEVESTKNVAQIYAPLPGRIAEVNEALEDDPGVINESPYEEGWLVRLEVDEDADADELLTPDEYEELCSGLSGDEVDSLPEGAAEDEADDDETDGGDDNADGPSSPEDTALGVASDDEVFGDDSDDDEDGTSAGRTSMGQGA
ncbi:MAG: glycine cleavage system protein GcvH [Pseudoclavibacter sp.]|jgi:glycine cleavage system H protein